jgi:hypothetical protein
LRLKRSAKWRVILLKLLAFRIQGQVDIEDLVAANSDKLDLDGIRAEWQNLANPRTRPSVFLERSTSN